MFSSWIKRLSPQHKKREKELAQASRRVAFSIKRYKDTSKEIQEEIANNGFAPFLIYDRGVNHGGH
ncbi:hypothetical protein R70723_06785 [Paenibacillus sp. FSL R7-0273]|nr:hypothetical protein R70723_06785 [Paenibacillus sp. FSL R7-0273]OMF95152.1 hypothetical protein BK144_06340 [Paenibacillus sp. FSL R7-0273]